MIILGLILLVVAIAGGGLLLLSTQALDPIAFVFLNQTYEMAPMTLVIAGIVATTLLWWGWALLRIGMRRRARKSKEAKEAARQSELDRAAREKETQEKWERELRERERQARLGDQSASSTDPT